MENKYYTPEIEEFCVGFEYESRIAGYDDEWTKETIYAMFRDGWESNIDDVLAMYRDGGDEFRVKYLDSSDIESLGFEPIDYVERYRFKIPGITAYIKENIHISFYPYEANIDESVRGKIWIGSKNFDYKFKGTIKNLSELKKLLKQTKNYE